MGKGSGDDCRRPMLLDAAFAAAPAAVADPPAAEKITRDRLLDLCAEYDMDVAAALRDDRFYHVAFRDDLTRIAQDGLLPLARSGRPRNFTEFAIDEDCVYLWPGIGNAQGYIEGRADRFDPEGRVVLEIEGVELHDLCPDQEELTRMWEEEGFGVYDELLARAAAEAGPGFPAPGEPLEHAQAVELIKALTPDTRVLLANACAISGDAVMVRAAVAPERIQVAELATFESLQERFDEENPIAEEDVDDPDVHDARFEAFDEWVIEHYPELEVVDVDALREQLQDPTELAENHERRHFVLRPLR